MNQLIKIDESGKTTAKELYEFLQLSKSQFSRWYKTNIEENEFYPEGVDWWGYDIMSNGNETKDYSLTIDFAKHLCMLSRSERGKQARNYFIEVEKQYMVNPTPILQMSQMQIVAAIAQAAADQEKQIQQISATQTKQAEELQGMRDVISLDTTSWRTDTKNLLVKMAIKAGDVTQVKEFRSESYKLLDARMAVSIQVRLTNKRRRMADEGVCKSSRDNLNVLDVIAEDKKLIEGYVAIIKEMSIRVGVS
jgi:anti-repressor protein